MLMETEPPATPDPERSIGFLLSDVTRLLRRDFMRRALALGLSQAQWQALAHLSRQEGVNQVTLADRLDVQPITLARLIDRLQDAGLVERRPDPGDRRALRLYLTAAAKPVLASMWSLAAETREAGLGGLPETRREALIETLQQIKRNLLDAADRGAAAGGRRRGNDQE
jgi:MarR family transcriptional regulator, transcriptional regulator for hemolysin